MTRGIFGPAPPPSTMTAMDIEAELVAPCSPDRLFEQIDDLSRYPDWLSIVPRAVRVEGDGGPDASGTEPVWAVDLRGRMGPLARSKRLRMVRTERVRPERVRFERLEVDGRDHSAWVLSARVAEHPDGSHLKMRLHYGGSLFASVLEPLLREEIERSKRRLVDLVSGSDPGHRLDPLN